MLKSKATRDLALPTAEFIKFNEKIFYDSYIKEDVFTPLDDPAP
jgi:hypothetical protein